MMRPLVMDFPNDRIARDLNDEYMFGPALLVAPITQYQQRDRPVYLPAGTTWYDYWTGKKPSSSKFSAPSPYNQIPVFVRAGSIIPYGPVMQYVGEKPSDPTTLYVYAGSDGQFTLYEDEGTTLACKKGAISQIPLRWDNKTNTLTIGKRTGSCGGMLVQRTFHAVLVSKARPVAFSLTPTPFKSVQYAGAKVRLKLQ